MKKCSECGGEMKELTGKTPEGVQYHYYRCGKCGEEIVDMKQLHNVAQKYREMKTFHAKISRWGMSLGIRIPKELVKKYNFKDEEEVTIIPEEKGMKVMPA
jgi:DNA-directed RNA polymerase subunit RPC12/RpoP